MKKTSSKWIKGLAPKYGDFHWQRGYADFSVSPSQLDPVLDYVSKQADHHCTRTFQDEYREFYASTKSHSMSATYGIDARVR